MARDICIDLGTSNTVISEKNKGVILCEPTVAAIDKATGKIVAAGHDAKGLLGKTPSQISVVSPVKSGAIADFDAACAMLKVFLESVMPKGALRPRACVCFSGDITQMEKSTILEAVARSGAKSTYTLDAPIASALGAGIKVSEPAGYMILDLGGGKMCASVISFGGVITSVCTPYGGKKADEYIVEYIRKNFGVKIGEKTAENLKISIGNAYPSGSHPSGSRPSDDEKSMTVTGRSEKNGLPAEITVTESQIREAISPILLQIVDLVQKTLTNTPAELAEDLKEHGIHLCGGGAGLSGLSRFIEENTGFRTTLCEDAHLCAALGAQALLDAGGAQ